MVLSKHMHLLALVLSFGCFVQAPPSAAQEKCDAEFTLVVTNQASCEKDHFSLSPPACYHKLDRIFSTSGYPAKCELICKANLGQDCRGHMSGWERDFEEIVGNYSSGHWFQPRRVNLTVVESTTIKCKCGDI